MKDCKFSRAHFPRGTVVEIDLGHSLGKKFKTVTVDRVTCNGPDSWIIQTTDRTERMIGADSYHLRFVNRVIERGTLPELLCTSFTYNEFFHYMSVITPKKKNKTNYYVSMHELVVFMLSHDLRYRDFERDHLFDTEAISKELAKHFGTPALQYQLINKKKFHRLFKRVISKHKINRAKAQRKLDYENTEDFFKNLDDEYEGFALEA